MNLASPPTRPPPLTQKSGWAVASLMLGIGAIVLFLLAPILGIAAIICGHKARSDIRKSGGRLEGRGMALAGLTTGYLATLLVSGLLVAALLLPRLTASKRTVRQPDCRENLQLIQGYKEMWALQSNRSPFSVPQEEELFDPGKYMETKPVCPTQGTYLLNAIQDPPYCTTHGSIPW